MKIDPDYFDDWRNHPLTSLLFQRCREWSDQKRDQWLAMSWGAGNNDEIALARLRQAAITLEEVSSVTREQLEEDDA